MFWKLYLIALPIFFAFDMLWLGVVAKSFYAKYIGAFMKADVNWIAAISFYLLFIIGLVIFVLIPAIQKESWIHAIVLGGLFGLISYATYDLTNLATLKDWPVLVAVVDLVWGAVLGALVSMLTYIIARHVGV